MPSPFGIHGKHKQEALLSFAGREKPCQSVSQLKIKDSFLPDLLSKEYHICELHKRVAQSNTIKDAVGPVGFSII